MRRLAYLFACYMAPCFLAGCGNAPDRSAAPATPPVNGASSGQPDKAMTPADNVPKGPAGTPPSGGNTAETPAPPEQAPPVKLATLDLSAAGLPLTMQAPEGATATSIAGVDVRVKQGTRFDLMIENGPIDLVDYKKQSQENTVAPILKVLVDKPDEFVFETEVFRKRVAMFEANIKAGDKTYHVRDGRGPGFDNDLILKCAKTLAPK